MAEYAPSRVTYRLAHNGWLDGRNIIPPTSPTMLWASSLPTTQLVFVLTLTQLRRTFNALVVFTS